MAHLLADEDFPFPAVLVLRRFGQDVLTAHEAGLANKGTPDPAILTFGTALGRAVMTMNRRHYICLHRLMQPHAGIVICTDDRDHAGLALRIHQTLSTYSDLTNTLLRVNRPP